MRASGGTGIHAGLKILWLYALRVRVPPRLPMCYNKTKIEKGYYYKTLIASTSNLVDWRVFCFDFKT